MSLKILLVDNKKIVRNGIGNVITKSIYGCTLIECGEGQECINLCEKIKPDIIIMDNGVDNPKIVECVKTIRKFKYKPKILVMVDKLSKDEYMSLKKCKLDGVICLRSEISEFIDAIISVADGHTYVDENINKLIDWINIESIINNLTKREYEILKLIAMGDSNKEIGVLLNITERTVKNHISSLFKKIGVSDRTQAAVLAVRYDVI